MARAAAGFFLPSDIDAIVAGLGDDAESFDGKTIMLCGGRGFLGRYFTEVFARLSKTRLKKPCKLIVLDNLITAGKQGAKIDRRKGFRFIEHDIIEPLQWKEPLDFIIQAAGIASPFYYRAYPLETLEVAIAGTKNMLALAREHRAKLLFFSSSEIYGDPDPKHVPTRESYRGNVSCHGPRACYDESKRLGETLCSIFHEEYGTSVTMVRPFNVYGPGMQESDYRVLPNFASCLKGGRALNLYGTGKQTRTFCYITDAIVGFLLTLLRGTPGEAYNIGNPKPEISMIDLVKRTEKVLRRRIKYNVVEYPDSYPADEVTRRCPDIRKASLQLKYSPEVPLDEGLKRFFSWTDRVFTGELSR